MNLSRRKLFRSLLVGIPILVVLGFLGYLYTFPRTGGGQNSPNNPTVSGGVTHLPPGSTTGPSDPGSVFGSPGATGTSTMTTNTPRLYHLTNFSVVSPSLNPAENKVLFYQKEGGHLLSMDFNAGSGQQVSNLTIAGILSAMWSPAHDRAAVFYIDGEDKKGFLQTGSSTANGLQDGIRSFSWLPNGTQFAYTVPTRDVQTLVTATTEGKKAAVVFDAPVQDALMQWASPDTFAFTTAPSGVAQGFLFTYSRTSRTFQKIFGPAFGLTTLFSPDGAYFLASATQQGGSGLRLGLYASNGSLIFNDPTLTTLTQKCAWANTRTVYCAVPRQLPSGIWPDVYLRGMANTGDRMIRIDVDKKEMSEVFNENALDISDLILSKDQQYLFFINRVDGTLWRYRTKE